MNNVRSILVELERSVGPAVTTSEKRDHERIALELDRLGHTAFDVAERAANYRAAWPNVTLTANSLLKHWSRFRSLTPDQRLHGIGSVPCMVTPDGFRLAGWNMA